ncbi:uncharacterized protein LOC144153239 [Haemaphysalis longicornis]
MADLERIVALGKEMGFEGTALQEFLREERAAERERRREEDEREREREVREKEREERERERAARDKEGSAQRVLEMDKEMELLRTRSEAGSSGSAVGDLNETQAASRPPAVSLHKLMAAFNEKGDDLDAYLTRFERVAEAQKWPRSQWATTLSTCLTGEALSVFGRMPASDSADYDKVKRTLLLRFRLTEEGFRKKFRGETPRDDETPSQFFARLENYWERWLQLSGTERAYQGVKSLLLSEQFLENCGPPMALFLKEKKTRDTEELVQRADDYVMARNMNNFGRKDQKREDPLAGRTADPGRREQFDRQPHPPAPGVRCYLCYRMGHVAAQCRANRGQQGPKNTGLGAARNVSACLQQGYSSLSEDKHTSVDNAAEPLGAPDLPVVEGRIKGRRCRVLRDTGCNIVIVSRRFVDDRELTGAHRTVHLADRTARKLPEARIQVDTPYYSGEIVAGCMDDPLFDLILGNVDGVRPPGKPYKTWTAETEETQVKSAVTEPTLPAAAVTTRQQARAKTSENFRALRAPTLISDVSAGEMREDQQADETLLRCFEAQRRGTRSTCKRNGSCGFFLRDGLLFREYVPQSGAPSVQLVVPEQHRYKVLHLAHAGLMAGHLGRAKTIDRILADFFWPGLHGDVKRFIASCDICQRTVDRGTVRRVPLERVPLVDTPFRKVAIDIVGPLKPTTRRGNRYILTLVDYGTRFPEAVALPSIETERVAEALLQIFSRVGVPEEMLSDRGSNFTSELMTEVGRLLSLRLQTTTPYHPMANGLVEKMNGTLKKMLRRMCAEQPREWDRFLEPLLFAYREVAQASTGFSPFELLYGRNVRGPLAILKELWTGNKVEEEVKTAYQYVIDLKERLETTCQLAHEALEQAAERYKAYYDDRAKMRHLQAGDEVLVLLPTEHNKLTMKWKGPYAVAERKGEVDYVVNVEGTPKTFHANMLKKYIRRELKSGVPVQTVSAVAVDIGAEEMAWPLGGEVGPEDIVVSDHLTTRQAGQLHSLLSKYKGIFSDQPGLTTWAECSLSTMTDAPIQVRQYPLPFAVQQNIEREVSAMVEMGVIERSSSPYHAPVVLVRKPDGTYRFCVDFRRLNDVLVPDAGPIPRADCLIAEVGGRKYFSKMDFSKGYWQVPLDQASREKTAFSTPSGLYHFKSMPFGIKTAPAVFAKLMRRVLDGIDNVYHYYDDVLVATETWEDHLVAIDRVLARILEAGMTVHPRKCQLGFEQLSFLGHTIGHGHLGPMESTLDRIRHAARPVTKRQVRAFLGLSGYYRDFIPGYATVAAPLTDLTKKLAPNTVKWGDREQRSFEELKRILSEAPVLQVVDFDQPFVLRTDASDQGLGAVLLQRKGAVLHPVAYASRKLLPRERAYSAIEKECLAIVWAVKRFNFYLYGRAFTIQTDHQPLTYIRQAQFTNARVLRWALLLQEYDFTIASIKGRDNVGADYLSRV